MQISKAKQVALTGMLFALAVVLSWLEALLAPMLGLPPGVKIGLANCVVLYALLYMGRRQALLLVVLKAGFALLTRGGTAAMLSAAGGLLSFAIMAILAGLFKARLSVLLVSVAGALGHNAGQLLVVRLLFGNVAWYYAPVLAIAGVAMGALTAGVLRVLLPALQRAGLAPRQQPGANKAMPAAEPAAVQPPAKNDNAPP